MGTAANISVKKPKNPLYPMFRELGMFTDLHQAFSFDERLTWASRNHHNAVFRYLVSFLDNRKKIAYTQGNHDAEALFCFLRELILKDHQDLSKPLESFRQNVRPLIELARTDGSEEETLQQMIKGRQLTFRFTPATSPLHPEEKKLLNRGRLDFRIDGYNVAQMPESYILHETWTGEVLIVNCYFLESPKVAAHDLFVDICDNGGTSARYLEYEFEFKKGS
jgi:hypothetical protein